MILARVEPYLEAAQPEEQHGFRSGRRLEEHLLTANTFIDKSVAAGFPIWVISLDLSKAFVRVQWRPLWQALQQQGLSAHMIWLLQSLYHNQVGEVQGEPDCVIGAGACQGCVLSPRLFSAVLHFAGCLEALVGAGGF